MVGAGNYRAHGPNPACELFLLSFQRIVFTLKKEKEYVTEKE